MSYIIIPPCAELKDFVNQFWARKWPDSTYYSIATTCIELTFGFKSLPNQQSEFFFSLIKGQSDIFGQYLASGSFELFGVSLYSMAEIELSALSKQCLNRRMATILKSETQAWSMQRNEQQVKINWQFTKEQARVKLGRHYQKVNYQNAA